MSTNINVNTGSSTLGNALVASPTNFSLRGSLPEFVLGSKVPIALYFLNAQSSYESWTLASGYSIQLSVGSPGGNNSRPTEGDFDLTYGGNSATDLDYNITPVALETALNALASITSAGGLDITGTAGGPFFYKFRSSGARTNFTANTDDLNPRCGVDIQQTIAGDGSTRAQGFIRIRRSVAVNLTTFTDITNGFSGVLDFNTSGVVELLAGSESVQSTLEIEVTPPGGSPQKYAQIPITLRGAVIDPATVSPTPLDPAISESDADARYPTARLDITGLQGGTSTDLDGIDTADITVDKLYILPNVTISATVVSKQWILVAGTDAENAGQGIIRPDDYNASTNAKVWKAV